MGFINFFDSSNIYKIHITNETNKLHPKNLPPFRLNHIKIAWIDPSSLSPALKFSRCKNSSTIRDI